jgi:hypothetical protein
MIGPYKCCSVVQGDCLELMKQLSDRLVCECGADVTGEGGLFHCLAGHQNRADPFSDFAWTNSGSRHREISLNGGDSSTPRS